jgi:hypothetical protein
MPDPAPPAVGEMNLYSAITPPLRPGPYQLKLEQAISGGGAISPVTRHLEVTAPRFNLAGSEIHGVFPPPNAQGAFENRLAQVALRRGTLPWERDPGSADALPWLALVVLADGEANYLSGVAIGDSMTREAFEALDVSETGTCDTLEVSELVVRKVFPRADELPLLCHVRQLNLADTEYAAGDDDGFVAAVLSNRLPQANQRYGAYLISLEGQTDELPTEQESDGGVDVDIGGIRVYELDDRQLADASYSRTGETIELSETAQPDLEPAGFSRGAATRWGAAAPESEDAVPAAASGRGFVLNAIDFAALHDAVNEPPPRLLRFPVLAHWAFECSGGGDFQTLVSNLDVGLLGTPPASAPEGVQIADTGHTLIDHITRRGEQTQVWYRGPFTARQVVRRAGERPYHVADQARRIASDLREDLSEAIAFELGRLLALANPSFAAALLAWRRTGIAERANARARESLPGDSPNPWHMAARAVLQQRDEHPPVRRTALALLAHLAGTEALGEPVPVDPPELTALLDDRADAATIATGLNLPPEFVANALSPGITREPLPAERFEPTLDTGFNEIRDQAQRLESLAQELDRTIERVMVDAKRPARPDPRQQGTKRQPPRTGEEGP